MPWKSSGTSHPGVRNAKRLSPRAKLALRALILGVAKTNKEAGMVGGLHPAYVGCLKNGQLGKDFMAMQDNKLDEKLIETSQLMELFGREALNKMGGLMRFSADENIILRSAQDLMDRAPTTMKIQKHQVESFTLSGRDAKEIASAMVESAKVRKECAEAAVGNFVRIEDQKQLAAGVEDAA